MTALLPEAVHRLFAQQHGVVRNHATARHWPSASSDPSGSRRISNLRLTPRRVPIADRPYRRACSRCAAFVSLDPYAAIAGPTAGRIWGLRRLPPDWLGSTSSRRRLESGDRTIGSRRIDTACDPTHQTSPNDPTASGSPAAPGPPSTSPASSDPTTFYRSSSRPCTTATSPRRCGSRGRLVMPSQRPWLTSISAPGRAAGPGAGRRVAPGGTIVAGPARRPECSGWNASIRSISQGTGSARFDLAVPPLRWRSRSMSILPHRETAGITRDRRRDQRCRGGGLVDVAHLRRRLRARFDATIADLVRVHARLSAPNRSPASAKAM